MHDRMVSEGRAPKVYAAPVKVGGLTKPVWQQKEEEEEKKHKIGFSNMQGRGVKIGSDKVPTKPVGRGSSHGVMPKPEPMRFSTCKKPTGAAASSKLEAHRAKMQSNVQKTIPQGQMGVSGTSAAAPRPNGGMMTLAKL